MCAHKTIPFKHLQTNEVFYGHLFLFSYAVIDCGPPPNISGCDVSVEATSCGSVAMYEAHEDLIVKGDSTITCSENGEWTGDNGFTMCKGTLTVRLFLLLPPIK